MIVWLSLRSDYTCRLSFVGSSRTGGGVDRTLKHQTWQSTRAGSWTMIWISILHTGCFMNTLKWVRSSHSTVQCDSFVYPNSKVANHKPCHVLSSYSSILGHGCDMARVMCTVNTYLYFFLAHLGGIEGSVGRSMCIKDLAWLNSADVPPKRARKVR